MRLFKKTVPKKKKKMKFDLKRLYFEKVLFENVLSNRQVYWVKKYNFIWRILMIIYKKNYYSIFCNEIKLNQTFPLPFVLFLKLLAIAGFCLHFFFFFGYYKNINALCL